MVRRERAEEAGSFLVQKMKKSKHDLVVPDPGEVLNKLTEDECFFVKCVHNMKTLSRPREWSA